MIVVKDKPIAIGMRGSFVNISGELSRSGFTGLAEVSYKLDEISKAKIVFIKGRIVDCKITKLISKTEINGDYAINELLRIDKCVVDLYTINESSIDNFGLNEVYLKDNPFATTDVDSGLEQEIMAEESSIEIEVDREEILKKYRIKEPSEEEIEAIILRAVEDEFERLEFDELGQVKKELKAIARKYLGKLAKKIENSIDQSTVPEELFNLVNDIKKSKSLLVFVPKEKLNKLIEEMNSVLKVKNVEKVNS